MKIPTKHEWGSIEKNNLDTEWAYKQFAGKSLDDAEKMFRENALYYQEDLISMPSIAFNCYAPVFAKYILSDYAESDSDGASSFLHMIIELLQANRSLAAPETVKVLLDAAKIVSNKQNYYDADIDIYGEFSELYNKIILLADRTYRDRKEPHSSSLPHHAAYGSVLRGSADQASSAPGKRKGSHHKN